MCRAICHEIFREKIGLVSIWQRTQLKCAPRLYKRLTRCIAQSRNEKARHNDGLFSIIQSNVTNFYDKKVIPENRHTAEERCPGRVKRGLAPQEIFHCSAMKNLGVCDASFCIRKNWIPRTITHAKPCFAWDPIPRDDGTLESIALLRYFCHRNW